MKMKGLASGMELEERGAWRVEAESGRANAQQGAKRLPRNRASVHTGAMTGDTEFPAPGRATLATATLVVAAVWFYFLIFAEHALLDLGTPWTEKEPWRERGLLTCLGAGGLLGSLWGAWRFNVYRWQAQLSWSLRASAVGAALALGATLWGMLAGAAVLSGFALGWLTVTLATGLRPSIGTSRLGLVIGLGTGLAYAAANLPFIFTASAKTQSIVAAVAVAAVSVLSPFLTPQEPSVSPEADYRPGGVLAWLLLLAPLVAVDAAVFYSIQHTEELRETLWSGHGTLLVLAVVHLLAGGLAGWALDGGSRWGLWLSGATGVGAAAFLLRPEYPAAMVWAYAAGVSVYSALLVYLLARGGRAWITAVVFIVAGWLGSALGIRWAQTEPEALGSGAIVLAGLGLLGSGLLWWMRRTAR
jgi:cytochrome c oxidase cbb3-type subunit 2